MRDCLLCGEKKNSRKIGRNKAFGFDIMYCDKCRLGYFLEEDSLVKKKLADYYKKDYWHSSSGDCGHKALVDKLRRFVIMLGVPPLIAVSHIKIMKEYNSHNLPNHYRPLDGKEQRLIDIGCGQGDALRFFKSKGYQAFGIESDKMNVKKINSLLGKGSCIQGDAENIPLNHTFKKRFDVIYLCHVLEHFVSPLEFLRKARGSLSKDGVIFIEVPNCENKKMMKISLGMESHIYHFTHKSLRMLLEKAGYKIIMSGAYNDASPSQLVSFFLALLRIPSYKKAKPMSGKKIIIIAKR